MRGINKTIILGHVGSIEMKTTNSGAAVANLSIAVNESWKDKQTGEKKEQTEWLKVVFFHKLAEICGQWVKKGDALYVEGQIKTRKWQDKEGQDRYTTEIVGREMQMLGTKDSREASPTKAQESTQYSTQNKVQTGSWEDIPF